ncbi:sarcosine oxidase subunit gamma [Methylobacterium nigriterrae]|uniref:sarcosine oxidase subunit gamma n=1 Tax=Methylobacterium nigriterrae TaxID=3127512 RepID=UPI003014087A
MSEATIWQPRSAWAGLAAPGRHGRQAAEPGDEAGVRLSLREGIGLATLIAAEGQEAALARTLSRSFGLPLPETGTAHFAGERGLVWSAPGQWLAVAGTREGLHGLATALRGLAAVSDQSDGRALLRVSGRSARAALAKGVAVDLHPRAFRAGRSAVTSIAHIGAQIWQRDEAPTYEIAVARSFAGSFWSWLAHAAVEFGYAVESGAGP